MLKLLSRDGLAFLLLTCLFACCALLLNGALVMMFYGWVKPLLPGALQQPRSGQLIIFILPLLLMVGQWWLVDRLHDWLAPGEERG